jgi:hypothetical protein
MAVKLRLVDATPMKWIQWTVMTASLLLWLRRDSYVAKNRERLSAAYLKRLGKKREKLRLEGASWRPAKPFTALPESSQQRARGRKKVLAAYYTAVEIGLPPSLAELVAREMGLLQFGKAPCARNIRGYVRRVESFGGPDSAPISAYADSRSGPHRSKNDLKEGA